jgi:hypothetical protein
MQVLHSLQQVEIIIERLSLSLSRARACAPSLSLSLSLSLSPSLPPSPSLAAHGLWPVQVISKNGNHKRAFARVFGYCL